ncbi:MAG: 3-oxoacyl-[acyl-carrier-protein] reductase [Ktedonobacter sp. 13_1_20CM_4_53_11]|nr:MAG: 3-oxoacyl-[acyl-carrier-protein] reductase [Ktedonobacter sp. 13_2_20CM_53_11]OLE06282.1 MAG: 3-oxoacyl-[acyl-carrier-protein] reductase [Ktedonobacter sp. 13_1_20CM_4_53_11]TMD86426.1 MAG: 3-oxoacyl-ACP reductase FabG [Chloroflexota bacterium]
MGTIDGAVVVVTGGARGIGRAIAEEIGREGARVVVNYAKSKEAAEDLVAQLQQNGSPGAVAIQADVSDAAQAAKLIEETLQQFGRIDVLVNNAGINVDRSLKNLTPEDWDKVIKNDLSSYFYTTKAALPQFTQQKSGKIINISSVIGQMGNFGQANYAAAKAGIIGLTKTAALELARSNITVNAICPGFIATEMFESMPDKAKEAVVARIPLGRVGTAHEVARAVRYLIVDGDYITGASLNINGGLYLQ